MKLLDKRLHTHIPKIKVRRIQYHPIELNKPSVRVAQEELGRWLRIYSSKILEISRLLTKSANIILINYFNLEVFKVYFL